MNNRQQDILRIMQQRQLQQEERTRILREEELRRREERLREQRENSEREERIKLSKIGGVKPEEKDNTPSVLTLNYIYSDTNDGFTIPPVGHLQTTNAESGFFTFFIPNMIDNDSNDNSAMWLALYQDPLTITEVSNPSNQLICSSASAQDFGGGLAQIFTNDGNPVSWTVGIPSPGSAVTVTFN